ncbi:glycosyltransferase [Salinimicrobium tongyeongense]|uniref:Glycosyltransferase n=1 Tax=Salinimicrobium tongyeongense TaxID=2809707 RepID=A0ABY6NRV6_9FLAO|nr:glycosyltransferase [Salinimicrobium tongyeongense]UZH55632.1 glycosyltransferase [Salinimicrobium tongyeongense]
MTSLKEVLYLNYISLRPAALLSYYRNGQNAPVHYYVNNRFNSGKGLKIKEREQLRKVIGEVDSVFIIAHLFSLRIKEISIASEAKKKIIFRTTGSIELRKTFPDYLEKVTHFFHHSHDNAHKLHNYIKNRNYSIIDQSAPNEELLLKIPPLKRQPSNFVAIGRFSAEKNFQFLISEFKKFCHELDKLYLIGDGELKTWLLEEKGGNENIIFMGQRTSGEVAEFFRSVDCLIIPSLHEAGPLVGIEAMAAAKIILSSPVGAMPERLKDTLNNFWFEPEDGGSLEREFKRIKNLSLKETEEISLSNRKNYLKSYSREKISNLYCHSIDRILGN